MLKRGENSPVRLLLVKPAKPISATSTCIFFSAVRQPVVILSLEVKMASGLFLFAKSR